MNVYIVTEEDRHISDNEADARAYPCSWAVAIDTGEHIEALGSYLPRGNAWQALMYAIENIKTLLKGKDGDIAIHLSTGGNFLPWTARKIAKDPDFTRHPDFTAGIRGITAVQPQVQFPDPDPNTMLTPGWQRAQGAATAALLLRRDV